MKASMRIRSSSMNQRQLTTRNGGDGTGSMREELIVTAEKE